MSVDPTQRFSNRVDNYVRYRPSYPAELVIRLQEAYGQGKDLLVADIGAGTGISSLLFLEAGYRVVAVEPNQAMREQAVALLAGYPGFSAVGSTAEDTGLDTGSVDMIVCAQAFHWVDAEKARPEWKRILKPGGPVALIWNERLVGTDFEKAYEALIRKHGRQYVSLNHRNVGPEQIEAFFQPQPVRRDTFSNQQVFDYEGLEGRLLSSSYMPAAGEEGYEAMLADLRILFDGYQEDGCITIHYETRVYSGVL
ncbi:class I SAM-dependent methyltransferase [Taibaiella koreensis]|uniref:class I SAM-dependent methyltransferase n=1 Tax=Taibaiella koreensis TaxID=1268548 RepID=UPI000E59F349|nr:class I SAM-dependent methyltransferase [Taibaiella koreensis]